MNDKSQPTNLQILSSLVSGTAKTESIATQRSISARIDLTTLARVDAFAQQSKKSRNEMINLLLDVGCEEVYANVESNVVEELQSRESLALQTSLSAE